VSNVNAPVSTIGRQPAISLHALGVICGLAAGVWLGTAEAPTKLVMTGISPFVITLGMVSGVFVARWTVPVLMKGSGFVLRDLSEKPHLIVWALLAGMLWVVANTLTVFAIRDVGLSIAFPLWNTNSLAGLFWGWLLFNELRGSGAKSWAKVFGGAAALVIGATILAYATTHTTADASGRALTGVLAALGAGALWGTQYIPYRKAYISGANPLSFVTVIAVGELLTTLVLGIVFCGGIRPLVHGLAAARTVLFWLFLGGICWVFGDLFQQYAAKYIGIGRGIPLSNTNQLWGLAWGALVFGELAGAGVFAKGLVIAGSVVMIAGAAAISTSTAPVSEMKSWRQAMLRECNRYGMDPEQVAAAAQGDGPHARQTHRRRWWEMLFVMAALTGLVWLGVIAQRPSIAASTHWMVALVLAALICLVAGGALLWRRTRFS